MTPRKPKPKPLSDAIAANIKRQRERHEWTQEQLAEEMRLYGFDWARMTVTEVEGGRRRQVSVAELLGLASIFGVGFEAFLWHYDPEAPLEVVPKSKPASEGFIIEKRLGLFGLLVSPESLAAVTSDLGGRLIEQQIQRLATAYIERVQSFANEMRDTAAYIERQAKESLTAITVDAIKGTKEAK